MAEEWIPQQEILGKYGYSVEIIRISKLHSLLLIVLVTERTSYGLFYNVYQLIRIRCSLYHIVA